MNDTLIISQIVVSCLLIVAILLQEGDSALGAVFGSEGGFYGTKRGLQKKIFISTIFLGSAFIVLTLLNLILS